MTKRVRSSSTDEMEEEASFGAGALPGLCLPSCLATAWASLSADQQEAFECCEEGAQKVAMQIACLVASSLRGRGAKPAPLIGRRAEQDVLELAARDLRQVVVHTSASPAATDGQIPMSIQTATGRVLIEVKSHGRTVPGDEVDKFLRDLQCNACSAAIFVSTRSPIAKIRKGLHVERVRCAGGAAWCLFVSPVHDMNGLVTAALAAALELAAFAPPSGSIPSAAEGLANALHDEVHLLGNLRESLRNEDARRGAAREQFADALTGAMQRLATTASAMSPKSGGNETVGTSPS